MVERVSFKTFWKGRDDNFEWTQTLTFKEVNAETFFDAIDSHGELLPYNVLLLHWDAYEANKQNVELISEKANFWIGMKDDRIVALTLGIKRKVRRGSEWCFTIYAQDSDAFKSSISYNIDIAHEKECNLIMCLHDTKFEEIHKKIKWFENIHHGFGLILYELVF